MRIGLLLSGNIRNFDASQPASFKISDYYSEIACKYNMDVFCFTDDNHYVYNDITHLKETYENVADMGNHVPCGNIVYTNHETASMHISSILNATFGSHLKKCKIIPYFAPFVPIQIDNPYHVVFYNTLNRPTKQKNNIVNSCYKLYCAYNLLQEHERENNIKYDIIIKSRFDCAPMDILNCVDIRELNYSKTLYCGHWTGFLYDHAAIGNRAIMHHYCNYYNTISPNLLDSSYCKVFWGPDDVCIGGSNINNYLDISDSMEYGLTYLIKHVHGYKLDDGEINFRYFIPGCF
jgi:hypothetical protein